MGVLSRVLPYAAGALALITLLSRLQGFAGPIAAVFGLCIVVGLFHASGRFAWVDGYPLLARAMDAYAPRPWRAAPQSRAPLVNRQVAGQQAAKPARPAVQVPDIGPFIGIEDQVADVEQLIKSQVFRQGGHAPIMLALVGALGTGKTSIARNVPGWLYKEGLIKSREVRVISRETLPGLAETGGLALDTREEIRQLAQEALGGVVLVEHIDRLTRPQNVAFEIGECLADVAAQFPVRLITVVTGSLNAYRALDPDDRWRHKFNICEVEFGDLSDDALRQIFMRFLAEKNLTLEANAETSLGRRLKELKTQNAAPFRNAVTIGRLFGAVLAMIPQGRQVVAAQDIRDARLPL